MVRESVRGCPREADAQGPAFPHDLHSVTAVTLSVLHSGPINSTFPGLEIPGVVACFRSAFPIQGSAALWGYWVCCGLRAPTVLSWRKGEKEKGQRLPSSLGRLGSTPHAYADILASRPVRPSHLHMYVVSPSLAISSTPLAHSAPRLLRYVRAFLVSTPPGAFPRLL